MSVQLKLRLLGGFEATVRGVPVTDFESETARALLAYLAVHQARLVSRAEVAELLWPGRPPGGARKNLRHTLSTLRRSLGEADGRRPILEADRRHLSLGPPPEVIVDVRMLDQLAHTSPPHTPHLAALEAAVELYRGPFLGELGIRGSPDWDDWLARMGERYRRDAVILVDRLVSAYQRTGQVEPSLIAAQRLVELDPWNERAHRKLMRLLASAGEPAASLSHFARLWERLARELEMAPAPETVALAERIRTGSSGVDEFRLGQGRDDRTLLGEEHGVLEVG
jgi:DNA-binding SARP family transcriptional activator